MPSAASAAASAAVAGSGAARVAYAASSPAAAADEMTDAEVRKVDIDAAKITLKHGDIKSLEMPAMTMVFNVRDKAMLGQVKAGDKVKFKAVNEAGKFTVTDLKVVR